MSNQKQLIESAAKDYSKERSVLAELVTTLDNEILRLQRKAIPAIKKAVSSTKDAEAKLEALLVNNANLFKKPRTWTIHGIKFGFAKQKGKIVVSDEENTITLIRKHLASKADVLIVKHETVSKEALANITVEELKKIGCKVVADTDAVTIKATDSNVDKLVTALLKNDEPDQEVA
ncbi:host-nuclease inhibitor Gam family protein [Methylophilus sp. YYY-1]|uniref:host-nuclease inhibitor Gam family protein n=1 Tax=Methylophilus sp. YYY-1 TaxID=2682087 RepID=UPI0023B33949|nr:host-nuclease inhibitor Gam family protein [Methylophilus sp. YYY-1]MDF0377666.1 hypothetical protein [Methylophilus sp. YYY-1]